MRVGMHETKGIIPSSPRTSLPPSAAPAHAPHPPPLCMCAACPRACSHARSSSVDARNRSARYDGDG